MKKVALITLHAVKNYGSVLQTFATQCLFEEMGNKVQVIDYRRPWETCLGYWFFLPDKSIVGLMRQCMYFPSKILQYRVFNRFLKDNIKLTKKKYSSEKELLNDPVEADIYCTGSDQVWNSGWNNGVIPAYFLSFVKKNDKIKKIAYAASFGNEQVTLNEKSIINPLLQDYDLITVRENVSIDLLKKEFGLEAYGVFDPTLQLTGNFWREFAGDDSLIHEDYVLLIQLNRNHQFDKFAIQFSNDKKFRLIRLCFRVDQIVLPGKPIVIPEIKDYITLIKNARYVLTDSFHAISFCLNLNKQFYCYYPPKYSSRLTSILQFTHLDNRVIINNQIMCGAECDINYEKINIIIDNERKACKELMKSFIKESYPQKEI